MTTALATMESEMVLLAMLPQDDRVLLVQTPRLRSIGDLEEFIVDEYARVFPHLPALSRDLRIQKCVAPNLVVDRRSHTTARKQAPHFFVDLAKNVQAGNVFENMEQIYIVANSETQTHGVAKKPSHRNATKKVVAEPRGLVKKLAAESHNAKKTTAAETQDASKEADAETLDASEEAAAETHSPAAKKELPVQKKSGNALLNKMLAMKHDGAKSAAVLVVNSLPAAEKESTAVQAKPVRTRKVREENVAVDGTTSAQQPPVKKMKKANAAVSEPASADSKAEPKTKKAPKKKAAAKSVAQADNTSDEHDTKAPKVKKVAKKKIAAESGDTNKTPTATEAAKATTTVTAKKSTKKAAEKPSEESVVAAAPSVVKATRKMKKKVDPETDSVKKPAAKRAKTEKSPKETLKAIVAKKAPEKANTTAKTAKKVELAVAAVKKPGSDSLNSSPPADELASAEKPEVAEPPIAKNAARRAKQHKADKASDASAKLPETSTATSATKPVSVPFSTILAATKERIAADNRRKSREKEGKAKPTEQEGKRAIPETDEVHPKPTSKSTENTASESSESDFEDKPVPKIAPKKVPTPASPKKKQPAKMVKASPKIAAAVESSSSSDEEELDYSQSLLADLTKNDTDDEQVKPTSAPPAKKTKKSKKTPVVLPSDDTVTETSQDSVESQDLLSSDLTQKCTETACNVC
ncbi:hypothetical protein BBJ28_00008816 [Nothophytophthora sp. Chile5]|nr:hypothetical protein BBJ28_00008816 [Nothophytophthora sp. Chile5]